MIAYAQTFEGVTRNITDALQLVMPILFLVATIVFLWGVILYITAGGEEDKIKKGRIYIIWGLIGLFVMVAVWGIVTLLCSAVFDYIGCRVSPPEIPDIPGGRRSAIQPSPGNWYNFNYPGVGGEVNYGNTDGGGQEVTE